MQLLAQDDAVRLHPDCSLGLGEECDLAHVVGLVDRQYAPHGAQQGGRLVKCRPRHIQQVHQQLQLQHSILSVRQPDTVSAIRS
jgi:hypothetical protein